MIMKVRSDRVPYYTNIRPEHLYPTSQLLARQIAFGPQPNKAIVGANAFAHEAGIHQDGYLKNPLCYEIMQPEMVGVPATNLVLGKHSGRHALHERVKDLGYEEPSRDQLNRLYEAFTALADNRKGLTNDDIVALVEQFQIRKKATRQPAEVLAPIA